MNGGNDFQGICPFVVGLHFYSKGHHHHPKRKPSNFFKLMTFGGFKMMGNFMYLFFVMFTGGHTVDGSEIPNANHLGCIKPIVNNGIHYQPQLVIAGFVPSTVWQTLLVRLFFLERWSQRVVSFTVVILAKSHGNPVGNEHYNLLGLLGIRFSFFQRQEMLLPQQLTNRPWKMMVGRLYIYLEPKWPLSCLISRALFWRGPDLQK